MQFRGLGKTAKVGTQTAVWVTNWRHRIPAEPCSVVERKLLAFGVSGKSGCNLNVRNGGWAEAMPPGVYVFPAGLELWPYSVCNKTWKYHYFTRKGFTAEEQTSKWVIIGDSRGGLTKTFRSRPHSAAGREQWSMQWCG